MQYQVIFSKRLIIIDKLLTEMQYQVNQEVIDKPFKQYEMQYQVIFSKRLSIIDKPLKI